MNPFDININAGPSFENEKKIIDTKYSSFLNQYSCTGDIAFGTLSIKMLTIGQYDDSQH